MIHRYVIPRTSVWGFEITIGTRFNNWIGPLCGISVSLRIFICLTFRYFIFSRYCKLGIGEWMNIVKDMLYGLHFYVTKLLAPQKKNIWGRSRNFIFTVENWHIDLSWRSWGSSIAGKVNSKIRLAIIRNFKRRFTIQVESSKLFTNSEGNSGSYTSSEQSLRYQ